MIRPTKKTVCFILFFGLITRSYCQESTDVGYNNVFDQTIGVENTEVYQGVLYSAQYRTNSKKTEFFKNQDFEKGSIFYSGQAYHNLDIKYDINNDRVFMKLAPSAGGGTLILFNDILQSFEIGANRFVKVDSTAAPELEISGFYEVSAQSSLFTLMTKYSKKRVKQFGKNSVIYEFVARPTTHILHYNNSYYNFNSKKEVKKLFPEFKKEIDKFYYDVRKLRKSDPEGFQVALIKRIELLISQQESE